MVTPSTAERVASPMRQFFGRVILLAASAVGLAATADAAAPRIRTNTDNAVPQCVTPKRLMAFLKTRNTDLDPRYADIARLYKKHGETWHVRWDYAFFQMAVETNFLTYRKGDGDWGDVNPRQNNFAGLGTTGGGVPGDSYPDVDTGVLAQIQHLVVYSGEHIDNPVGARTRLKQDDIIETMASKKGNTTFADLARRWAADKHYGASIEWVANSYRQTFCNGAAPVEEAEAPTQKPAKRAPMQQQALAQAANLGGPRPDETVGAGKAPVRTIWSASSGVASSISTPEAEAQSEVKPAVRKARVASVPVRKPAVEAAATSNPVISEQTIQTGEDPAPVESLAASPQPMPSTPLAPEAAARPASTASEPPPANPIAFAYAGALGSALRNTQPATEPGTCNVTSASYGGKKVLLVRAADTKPLRFTVLTVLEGFEKSMLDSYLKAHAPGGSSLGEFADKDAALAKAKELCSRAAGATTGEPAHAG